MEREKGQSVDIEEAGWIIAAIIFSLFLVVGLYNFLSGGGSKGCSQYNTNPRGCIEDGDCRLIGKESVESSDPEDGESYFLKCVPAVHSPHLNCNKEGCDCGEDDCVNSDNENYGTCKINGKKYGMCSY